MPTPRRIKPQRTTGIPMGKAALVLCLLAALIALFSYASCSCSTTSAKDQDESASSSSAGGEDDTPINTELLVSIMGEEDASRLIEGAQTNTDKHWIAAHPEEIGFEGETVQRKLLTLAANEDEAVSFVRHFADSYPDESAEGNAESAIEDDTQVPHLYQWDKRWGYTVYSSTAFGLTGCGPTAFAMAYQGVTGKHDQSPYDMGLLAQEMGHMAQYEGTAAAFLYDAASYFGMSCQSLPLTQSSVTQALGDGAVLIANVDTGYFSHFGGHYLVIAEVNEEGKLVINDPYSAVNSQQTWDIDFILGETKALYAFQE